MMALPQYTDHEDRILDMQPTCDHPLVPRVPVSIGREVRYERELTYGRSTLRFSVWIDRDGEPLARLQIEPSSGLLHALSMDLTGDILDAIANMAMDAHHALDDARGVTR